jgi:hypothetical protein
MAYQTWQLDNVRFHLRDKPPGIQPRTPALWRRWPETWRQYSRPSPLDLVCLDPLPWNRAVALFAPLSGRPLTSDEFIRSASVAYGIVLHHRWRGLSSNVREAYDIKSGALAEAYNRVIDEYADGVSPRPFANFKDFLVWFRTRAKNCVRDVRVGRQEEPQPRHVRRRRLAGKVECPWCWSAAEEHLVPRATRVCPRCGIGFPAGIWANRAESTCQRYANDPAIGPGVPSSVQLNERRLPRRVEQPEPEVDQSETVRLRRFGGLWSGFTEGIAAGLVLEEAAVPIRASRQALRSLDNWLSDPRNGFGRQRSYESVKRDLRDDSVRFPEGAGNGVGVAASRDAQWTGTTLAAERDGWTAPAARVHRAPDGAHRANKIGKSSAKSKATLKRIDGKISRAGRWLERWGREIDKLKPLLKEYEDELLRPNAARERRKAARRRAMRAGKRGPIEIRGSVPPRHGPRLKMHEASLELDAYHDAVDAVEELRVRRWKVHFSAKKAKEEKRAFRHTARIDTRKAEYRSIRG